MKDEIPAELLNNLREHMHNIPFEVIIKSYET